MIDNIGRSYEWQHNKDTGKMHRNCGGKIVNEMQINAAGTGVCDYRYRCLDCNHEFFGFQLKYENDASAGEDKK